MAPGLAVFNHFLKSCSFMLFQFRQVLDQGIHFGRVLGKTKPFQSKYLDYFGHLLYVTLDQHFQMHQLKQKYFGISNHCSGTSIESWTTYVYKDWSCFSGMATSKVDNLLYFITNIQFMCRMFFLYSIKTHSEKPQCIVTGGNCQQVSRGPP